ncbi:MAG: cache domain-containing protein [Rhizobiales bacterium]|nr:cache domain-containing protein [Hyphomicrobiales bacterium]
MTIKLKMSGKIYAVIGLSFLCLSGLAVFQLNEIKNGLEAQKQVELRHLGDVALRIVSEEYALTQSGEYSTERAKLTASARLSALRYGAGEYFWINDLHPRMIMHPIKPELNGRDITDMKDPNGKQLFVEFVNVVKRQGSGFVGYQWPKPGMADPQPKLSYVAGFEPWGWVIGTGVYIDDLQQQVWSSTQRSVIIGAAIILALGAGVIFSVRRMTSLFKGMTKAMGTLAAGNFDVVLPGLGRKDEIGDIAAAVEAFKHKAIEKAHLESEAAAQRHQLDADAAARRKEAEQDLHVKAAEERAKMAEEQAQVVRSLAAGLRSLSTGDLTFRLNDEFSATYRQIKDDFNTAIARLQETVGSIVEAAHEVTSASAEISTSTTDLSQRTEEQAASLEQTSASMEQISATVKKNAENAQAANQFAGNTRDVADHGGAVVGDAVKAMAKIEDSSRKISDIIGVIDEIARQTNLLALNAAVEAARAGEAGRGFAVVASEVRSLAQRSSQAAKDIKDLITNSNGQVKDGVELVNRAGTALTDIVGSIKKVADIVADIATASAEQAGGIEQVNKALNHMDEITQQNSALVEQNAATAKTLEQQSSAMNERMGFFQLARAPAAARKSAA